MIVATLRRDPRPVPCSAACAIAKATSFTARSETPPPRVARSVGNTVAR